MQAWALTDGPITNSVFFGENLLTSAPLMADFKSGSAIGPRAESAATPPKMMQIAMIKNVRPMGET
ncbi:MAG: hypothetical protein R3C40_07265 [Parvularculaceae bacterium]